MKDSDETYEEISMKLLQQFSFGTCRGIPVGLPERILEKKEKVNKLLP